MATYIDWGQVSNSVTESNDWGSVTGSVLVSNDWGLIVFLESAFYAEETQEAILTLVTIKSPDLNSDIHLTDNSEDITSNNTTYTAFPFRVELPEDSDEIRASLARLIMDSVDRRVVEAIRKASGQPTVDLQVVLSSKPNTIEAQWPTFIASNARYNAQTVEIDLVLELLDQEPIPGESFNPETFPGVF